MTPDELVEKVARAWEPNAFRIYDCGYRQQNARVVSSFLNAERTVKGARRKARSAILAVLEGIARPMQATPAMLDAGWKANGYEPAAFSDIFTAMIDSLIASMKEA